jgi:hypothetical protein
MVVNNNAGSLVSRGVLGFFASELAPTSWPSVGASLLTMDVNGNAGILAPRGVLGFFASELAPTRLCCHLAFCRSELARDGRQQ